MTNLTDHSSPGRGPHRTYPVPEHSAWTAALKGWFQRRLLRPAPHLPSANDAIDRHAEATTAPNDNADGTHFRDLIEGSIQGIHIHKKFKPVFANQACADMFGYASPQEILDLKSAQDLLPPHERKRTQGYGEARLCGRPAPTRYEVQGLRKDGTLIWIEQRCAVIEWDGEPAIQVTQVDITEQKEAEQALRTSERRFRDLVEGSVQGICIHRDFKPFFANQAYADIFGYNSPDEIYKLSSAQELVAPEERERLKGYALARLRGEKVPNRCIVRGLRKDGSLIWVEQAAHLVDWDGKPAIQLTLVDVTEQKESEHALRASEQRLRDLIAGSIQGITIIRDFRLIFANQTSAELYGYDTTEEMLALDSVEHLVAPEDWPRLRGYAEARAKGEPVSGEYEFRGIKKDGSEFWLLQRARRIDWEGEPATQLTAVDITEQKHALQELQQAHDTLEARVEERTRALADEVLERKSIEQALRSSEQRYRNLFESMQDGVFLVKDDHIVLANESLAEMLGYKVDSMIDREFTDFLTPELRATVTELHQRRLKGEPVTNRYEVELLHADGKTGIPALMNLKTIRTPSGGQAVLGTVRDITEQKRAEQALRESEERFRAIIDNSPSSISLKDADGRYLLVNAEFERCHGVSREEILGKTVHRKFIPSAANVAGTQDAEVLKTGKAVSFEVDIPGLDGIPHTRFATKFPIRDSNGKITRIGTIGTDITDLKAAEQALRESEERFRGFAQSSSDWLWELDAKDRFSYFSNRIFNILGIRLEKLLGKTAEEVSLEYGLGDGWKMVHDVIKERKPVRDAEYEIFGRDKSRKVFRTSGTPRFNEAGQYLGYIGTTTDITEEVLARESEAQVHERFLAAIETVPVGLALFDTDDRLVAANQRYRGILESNSELTTGTAFEDMLRAEVAAGNIREAVGQEETWIRDRMNRHRNPNGAVEISRANGFFQVHEHRTPDGFTLVVNHDISERMVAEQALVSARDELELRVQERTRALEQEIFERKYAQAELQKANDRLEERVEERTRHLSEEIAERKRFEEQFIQAQKMEAVGQLAGGIAHDFNNLLTVVIANLGWLKDFLNGDEKALSIANLALEGARRAGDLTQRMLAFSRRQELHPRAVDFAHRFEGMNPLIQRALRESIRFSVDIDADLWPLEVDPHQLESSLLNIAINARDAMPDGGTLKLRARNRTIVKSSGPDRNEPGDYVELSLTDTGTGMPREILDRVMDPFFTTKEVGKGSGLGLSMVFGFAKQSGGFLQIESEVGTGTSVKLLLPRSQNPCEPVRPVPRQVAPAMTDDITVLVVEDDEMVRNVTVEYLKMSGIEGLEADCGDAAIEILEQSGPVDLVISDVIMPGVSGIDLTQTIEERWPETRVVLMTGYSYEEFSRRGIDPSNLMLLHKPFSKQELLLKIQEALVKEG